MHNLLLGTAKNVARIWCKTDIISTNDLQRIQTTVNSIHVPVDVGRIVKNCIKLLRLHS